MIGIIITIIFGTLGVISGIVTLILLGKKEEIVNPGSTKNSNFEIDLLKPSINASFQYHKYYYFKGVRYVFEGNIFEMLRLIKLGDKRHIIPFAGFISLFLFIISLFTTVAYYLIKNDNKVIGFLLLIAIAVFIIRFPFNLNKSYKIYKQERLEIEAKEKKLKS
jgi:ABC-type antimicrobial peptide transport system permease subunit